MPKKTAPAKLEPRNAEVKTLREHSNQHGDKYTKAPNDTYVHPRPQPDIDAGLVELVEMGEGKPKAK